MRSLGVSHPLGKRFGREAAKDHGVHCSNSGACQHGNCMAEVRFTGSGDTSPRQDPVQLADLR